LSEMMSRSVSSPLSFSSGDTKRARFMLLQECTFHFELVASSLKRVIHVFVVDRDGLEINERPRLVSVQYGADRGSEPTFAVVLTNFGDQIKSNIPSVVGSKG
jgi:hypothetical protein